MHRPGSTPGPDGLFFTPLVDPDHLTFLKSQRLSILFIGWGDFSIRNFGGPPLKINIRSGNRTETHLILNPKK